MTLDDIIRMAREAGFDPHDMSADFTCNLIDIQRFAALVAKASLEKNNLTWVANCQHLVEAEREACARLCENMTLEWEDQPSIAQVELATLMDCALAIRNRGQQ